MRRLSEHASIDSAETRRRPDAIEERLRRLRDVYELDASATRADVEVSLAHLVGRDSADEKARICGAFFGWGGLVS